MSKLSAKLKELVEAEATNLGLFVVGQSSGEQGLYRFYVDSEGILPLKLLTDLTREVSKQIDEGDFGDTPFTFEVSSPGADKPLSDLRQFPKHVGRQFHVVTIGDEEFNGKLTEIKDQTLTFEIVNTEKKGKKKETTMAMHACQWSEIKEATIKISFK